MVAGDNNGVGVLATVDRTPEDQLNDAVERQAQVRGGPVRVKAYLHPIINGQPSTAVYDEPWETMDLESLPEKVDPGDYAITLREVGRRGSFAQVRYRVGRPAARLGEMPPAPMMAPPTMPAPTGIGDSVVSVLIAAMNNQNAQQLAMMQQQSTRDQMMMQAFMNMMDRKSADRTPASELRDVLNLARDLGGDGGGGGDDGSGTMLAEFGRMLLGALNQPAPAPGQHPMMPVPQTVTMPPMVRPVAPEPLHLAVDAGGDDDAGEGPEPEPATTAEAEGFAAFVRAYLGLVVKRGDADPADVANTLHGILLDVGQDPAEVCATMPAGGVAALLRKIQPALPEEFAAGVETALRALVADEGDGEGGEGGEGQAGDAV